MLIFDLDGTLIDSRRDIAIACNHALTTVGHAPLEEATVGTFVGDGARTLLRRSLGTTDETLVEGALDAFVAYYLAHPVVHTKLMPHVENALDALSHRRLVVATNKRRDVALAVLDALALRDRFADVWGGGDGAAKPDPSSVNMLLERSGKTARDAWMIGDGAQDIGAGKAAGVRTVAVLGGFHDEKTLRALEPDHVIDSMRELPELLR